MGAHILKSGLPLELRLQSRALCDTELLFRGAEGEVLRLTVAAGQHNPAHTAPGQVMLHCVEGRVVVRIDTVDHELTAGSVLFVPPRATHCIRGVEHSALLLVKLGSGTPSLHRCETAGQSQVADPVEEASQESFPASDAPSWTPVIST